MVVVPAIFDRGAGIGAEELNMVTHQRVRELETTCMQPYKPASPWYDMLAMSTYSSANVKLGPHDCNCAVTETNSKLGTLRGIAILQTNFLDPICPCVLCIDTMNFWCGGSGQTKEATYHAEIVTNDSALTLYHGNWKSTVRPLPVSGELLADGRT